MRRKPEGHWKRVKTRAGKMWKRINDGVRYPKKSYGADISDKLRQARQDKLLEQIGAPPLNKSYNLELLGESAGVKHYVEPATGFMYMQPKGALYPIRVKEEEKKIPTHYLPGFSMSPSSGNISQDIRILAMKQAKTPRESLEFDKLGEEITKKVNQREDALRRSRLGYYEGGKL